MNHRYSVSVENPLRESFDIYMWDTHAALNQITACTGEQARNLLRDMYVNAPHALAKALAIRYPWSPEVADAAESVIQESLPLG